MEPARYAAELEKLLTELATQEQADQRARGEEVSGARSRHVALVLLLVSLAGAVMLAQRGRNRRSSQLDVQVQGNTPYDGRFTFVRLRYDSGFADGFRRRRRPAVGARLPGRRGALHEDPGGADAAGDPHRRLEHLVARRSRAVQVSDRLHGGARRFWAVTETEATAFRSYLLKGGFAIFDDFRGGDWDNLQDQMRAVLPEAHWIQLDGTSRVFHSFFEIDHPETLTPHPTYEPGFVPSYWGLFEDNDPSKRLIAIANVNQDLSEYLGILGRRGLRSSILTNEAYKFGVNYVIYGLTH